MFWCGFFLPLKCDVYLRNHCFQTHRTFSANSGSCEYRINGQTAPEIIDAIAACIIFASGLYLDVQVWFFSMWWWCGEFLVFSLSVFLSLSKFYTKCLCLQCLLCIAVRTESDGPCLFSSSFFLLLLCEDVMWLLNIIVPVSLDLEVCSECLSMYLTKSLTGL